MSLLIGPATDYLVTKAAEAVAGLTVNGKPVAVCDGWPDELAFGMFIVGLSDPPPEGLGATVSRRQRITIGANLISDTAEIPALIDFRISGTSQKAVRDLAEQAFNAFWALIAADPSLGGLLNGGDAEVTSVTETPDNVGTVAEPGRRQLISFVITVAGVTT